MSGTLFCVMAFVTCLMGTVVKWRYGLCALMVWGYFFGILKAHFVNSWGHFIFDAATAGFYSGIIIKFPTRHEQASWKPVLPWVIVLMAWPVFMALIPIQHYLVQLVGLRGNMFWIPMLLVGAMLDREGKNLLSITFAVLNIIAFSFALAEYFLGVEMFVPENEVTEIVYKSNDIAGGHKRIPSIFTNAHSYAGTMVSTLPWLVMGLFNSEKWTKFDALKKTLVVLGLVLGVLGVFLAGPRTPIVILALLLGITLFSGRVNPGFVMLVILIGTIVAYFVAQNERMQRFLELQDLEIVSARLSVSVNMGLLDVLENYPMGNGLGSGGTSLPFFVQALIARPFYMENEYARILMEQGLPGLILFITFVCWFLLKRIPKSDADAFVKYLHWVLSAISFGTAWTGIGMMTSIPGTAMLLLGIGYCLAYEVQVGDAFRRRYRIVDNSKLGKTGFIPAYQRGLSRV